LVGRKWKEWEKKTIPLFGWREIEEGKEKWMELFFLATIILPPSPKLEGKKRDEGVVYGPHHFFFFFFYFPFFPLLQTKQLFALISLSLHFLSFPSPSILPNIVKAYRT
jgi:hypothetical protein